MDYYISEKNKIGSFTICKEKDIKGGNSDNTFLFVFSDLLNSEGEWLYVCRIEEFSEKRFKELSADKQMGFEIIEINYNKYITQGRCMLEYPEGILMLYSEEPEFIK